MSALLKLLLLGCGDIATRLAAQLPAAQYEISGLRRRQQRLDGITALRGDACDPDTMASLMQLGFDAVVVTVTPDQRSEAGYRDSYYRSMQSLLAALDRRNPPLVIFVSSTSVYGQNLGERVDEQSPTAPANFSGRVLVATERLLQASAVPHSIVRFAGIYGSGRSAQFNSVRAGRPLTSPLGWTNRIHSDDCAGVLAHLLEAHRTGAPLAPVYLASDGEPVMQWQLRAWLAERLGVAFAPGRYGELCESGKRCDNRRLLASGYRFRYPDFRAGYTALLQANNEDN